VIRAVVAVAVAVTIAVVGALLVCATTVAYADDPARRYRTIQTDHFRITYYELPTTIDAGGGEGALAQRLATVAEETHATLSAILGPGLSARRRTEVLITDDVDEANGAATVQPYPQVRLFATAPDDRGELADFDDWLRAIFVHEYTHVLHVGTIGGACATVVNAVLGLGGLGVLYAPNQTAPRFIIEGLAVFEETERTSAGRLRSSLWNMFLRTAALEGRLQRIDQIAHTPMQFPFGNSPYLYGAAFMRYLAARYGEATLRRFYEDYGRACVPGAINRSLRRAIRAGAAGPRATETWVSLYDDFRRELERRYRAQRDALAGRGLTEGRLLLGPHPSVDRPEWTPDGAALLVHVDDGHERAQIRAVDPASGRARTDTHVDGASGPRLSADGRWMVYSAVQPWRTVNAYADVYLYDRQEKRERRLTDGLRAAHPAISPDGAWVAFEINRATARGLALYHVPSGRLEELIPPRGYEQVYTPAFSPDGKTIAFSWWRTGGYRDIWTIDRETRALTRVTADRALDLEPRFSADGRWLYFTSDRTDVFNLYALERATNTLYQATNVLGGVFDPAPSPDGRTVAWVGFRADGYTLESAPLDPARFWPAAPPLLDRPDAAPVREEPPRPVRRYNPFWTLSPFVVRPYSLPDAYGQVLGLSFSGTDLVGHHSWSLSIGLNTGRADATSFAFNYAFRQLWPSVNFGVARSLIRRGGFVIDGIDRGWDDDTWSLGLSVGLPLLRRTVGALDLGLSYSLALSHNLTPIPEPDPNAPVPRYPEADRAAGFSLSLAFTNARRFRYSVSAEEGRDVSLSLSLGSRYLGATREVYTVTWRWAEYLHLPRRWRWTRGQVLALAYAGGISGGDPDRRAGFVLGGYPQQDLLRAIVDFSRPGSASLRGYPPSSIVGTQFHVLNVEVRFPIAWIERGLYKTLPLYFRRLHGKLFADAGGAFSSGFAWDQVKVGVGAELICELQYAWYFPAALQLGYAYGVMSGGANQVYFLLNSPF
jgi:hypothetical protein